MLIMNSVAQLGRRVLHPIRLCRFVSRPFCILSVDGGGDHSLDSDDDHSLDSGGDGGDGSSGIGFCPIEKLIKQHWNSLNFDPDLDGEDDDDDNDNDVDEERRFRGNLYDDRHYFDTTQRDADMMFDVLRQACPGFNVKSALSELNVRVSGLSVRLVLLKILRIINYENKIACAKLAFKFFVWCNELEYYQHTVNTYHLLLQILATAEEFRAMWRLVDEMTEKGYPTTARTFNLLIGSCCDLGMRRSIVERFVKSKSFNYRPFKNSYNAILVCLLKLRLHVLIEWVYKQMLADNHLPDTLTYNILIKAKYKLGKMNFVHRLLDEMGRNGFSPDIHTYNILLHVLGKGNKPYAALNLLNHMKEVGTSPTSLNFTSLIDGLSRAGNMEACKYFFDEMIKNGFDPDVVSYTVFISGYIAAGELEKAQELFNDMVADGKLPNVFTYNSLIRGLCRAGKFEEACSMLKQMENQGCVPNFLVYNTLITNLRRKGKLSEAHEIIKELLEKGQYVHRIKKFKRHKKY